MAPQELGKYFLSIEQVESRHHYQNKTQSFFCPKGKAAMHRSLQRENSKIKKKKYKKKGNGCSYASLLAALFWGCISQLSVLHWSTFTKHRTDISETYTTLLT